MDPEPSATTTGTCTSCGAPCGGRRRRCDDCQRYQRREYKRDRAKDPTYRKYVNRSKQRRYQKLNNETVPEFERGDWTPAENAIAMRNDIGLYEIACILQRQYKDVQKRRAYLRRRQARRTAPTPQSRPSPLCIECGHQGSKLVLGENGLICQSVKACLIRQGHDVALPAPPKRKLKAQPKRKLKAQPKRKRKAQPKRTPRAKRIRRQVISKGPQSRTEKPQARTENPQPRTEKEWDAWMKAARLTRLSERDRLIMQLRHDESLSVRRAKAGAQRPPVPCAGCSTLLSVPWQQQRNQTHYCTTGCKKAHLEKQRYKSDTNPDRKGTTPPTPTEASATRRAQPKPPCQIPECDNPAKPNGLCHGHNARLTRGRPLDGPIRKWTKTTPKLEKQVVRLRKQGLSVVAIAEYTSISAGTVNNILRRQATTPPRPRPRPPKVTPPKAARPKAPTGGLAAAISRQKQAPSGHVTQEYQRAQEAVAVAQQRIDAAWS